METGLQQLQKSSEMRYYCNTSTINAEEQRDPNFVLQEWEYQMRREMQEIIPGVFLGPYGVAGKSKREYLLSHGITHIVCVRQDIEANCIKPNFPDLFEYLILEIADSPTQNIIPFFDKARDFINNCIQNKGKVLVHGNAGISRSAALVVAYVMEYCNYSSTEALKLVQRKRFCIYPNEGFRRQLLEYEPILRAKGSLAISECKC
ncbi:serine/threonine/tyrosine-interacting protein-like isoform X2 [Dinothrombium tinctorium]|uniref:Serine/threonine/tyrosine-interacting protein-like isoform X2 n=1 Tax=Dinothrombium tinctorium TaxID=1965070 RepID=A0A3S4RJY6_9ACAR|nr:serine/threonine/tyrosine-interacting protein-like isoform X2 [Dinothrombium tinctorium]RWS17117.1 serine/threonine/tyrosine-interacting protein-like isoform X2 [Dinothrombium tinctorium]